MRSRVVSLIERADAVAASAVCLLVAISYVAAGVGGWSLAPISSVLTTFPAIRWIVDRTGMGEGDARVLLGGACAATAAGGAAAGGRATIGLALGAVGCWIAIDGLYERVHGDDAARTTGWMGVLTGPHRRVIESLQDARRPLTAAELADRTGLKGTELEATLEAVSRTDRVDRIGNGYAVEEGTFGTSAFVSRALRGVGRRLARPLGLFGSADRTAGR
ncbi:hypothetical protein [Saliphagus infecundisoli]|uniref:HTH iclR-type domain-containing protein n=1 Tax=Saliphagus infecundisoli TaxID=1849069 RepID=A0ABD5QAA7_9EURY|nr:hypothetical protein [Saliphagus infecundisoli]